jgi:hypothetical protein
MEILIIAFSVLLVVLVIWMSATGKFSSGGASSAASITAFHDMLPRDKQEAIEIVIEEKAGKKWMEQESGEGSKEEGRRQKVEGKGDKHQRGGSKEYGERK